MNAWKQSVRRLTRFRLGADDAPGTKGIHGGWLVLSGTCLGGILAAAGSVGAWMGGHAAGYMVAGVMVFAAEAWLTRGRGYRGLIRVLEQRLGAETEDIAVYARLCAFQVAVIGKAAFFAVICGRGLALWLPLTYALAAAVEWTGDRQRSRDGEDVNASMRRPLATWILACAVALLTAALSHALFAGLLAVVAAWLLPKAVCRVLAWEEAALAAEFRWEIAVLALLAIGTLAALG